MRVSRRHLCQGTALAVAGAALTACAPDSKAPDGAFPSRLDAFRAALDHEFRVLGVGTSLRLVRAVPFPGGPNGAFRLGFVAQPDAQIEQGVHQVVHPQLGVVELFLVPTAARFGDAHDRGARLSATLPRG